MKDIPYMTTKEFADFCGVEKRTLFYYDEISLLKPVYVNERQYRYYLKDQVEHMSMIKALQSIGMSLKEIKELMDERDIGKNKFVIQEQVEKLKEKQEALHQAEELLSHMLLFMDDYEQIGLGKIHVEVEEQEYLVFKQVIFEEVNNYVNFLNYGYHHGVTIDNWTTLKPSNVYKRIKKQMKDAVIKPRGTYLIIYLETVENNIRSLIRKFIEVSEENNIPINQRIYIDEISGDFFGHGKHNKIFRFSTLLFHH